MTEEEQAIQAARLLSSAVVWLTRLGDAGGPNATDYMNAARSTAQLATRIGGIAGASLREIVETPAIQ